MGKIKRTVYWPLGEGYKVTSKCGRYEIKPISWGRDRPDLYDLIYHAPGNIIKIIGTFWSINLCKRKADSHAESVNEQFHITGKLHNQTFEKEQANATS